MMARNAHQNAIRRLTVHCMVLKVGCRWCSAAGVPRLLCAGCQEAPQAWQQGLTYGSKASGRTAWLHPSSLVGALLGTPTATTTSSGELSELAASIIAGPPQQLPCAQVSRCRWCAGVDSIQYEACTCTKAGMPSAWPNLSYASSYTHHTLGNASHSDSTSAF
jgi:hypothetical protein